MFASDLSYSYSGVSFDLSTHVHQRQILSLAASAAVFLFVFLMQSRYFIQEYSESSWNARTYLCWLYMSPPAFNKPPEKAPMPCSSMFRYSFSWTTSLLESFEMFLLPVTGIRDDSSRTVSLELEINFIPLPVNTMFFFWKYSGSIHSNSLQHKWL